MVVALGVYVAHWTPFGRAVYAVGGNEQSALLMGLPVRGTIIGVYTLSGFCSALGGVLFTFYMLSGYGLHALGLELDAIAAVVIGGTLLVGGAGSVSGTLWGVLLLAVIQNLINQIGSLNSSYQSVVSGGFLILVVVAQRYLSAARRST